MPVDYGSIQGYTNDFEKTGFGFIERTLRQKQDASNNQVYFNIEQIRRKYPVLAQQLDAGNYQGVSFWYTTERTDKGEQVIEMWLEAGEMPLHFRQECIHLIRYLWGEIYSSLPIDIKRITVQLGGMELLNELQLDRNRKQREYAQPGEQARLYREAYLAALEEKIQTERLARAEAIRYICQQRGIQDLIHFTQIQNLASILHKGLLSRRELDSSPDISYISNDSLRIDGRMGAISLSISFPNYKIFYLSSKDHPDGWVILLLDAAILWELDCAFCQENAASNHVRHIPLNERGKASALEGMFLDYSTVQRKGLNLPDNYPTHPQAEVLVLEAIQPKYIKTVHFRTLKAQQDWQKQFSSMGSQPCVCCDTRFFAPRKDYAVWRSVPIAPPPEGWSEPPPEYS